MSRLVLFFLGLVLGTVLIACVGTTLDNRDQSPNFSDGEFNNVNSVEMRSFWEIAWHGLTSDIKRAQWPEWIDTLVDNTPMAQVSNHDTRVTFINHATFLIQKAGFNILTDPVFSERTSPFSFIGPKRIHKPGIEIDKLPKIDVILISHDHYDHLDMASLKQLIKRDSPKLYMGLGVGARMPESADVIELDWWQEAQVADDFKLWFLDVQHFSGRTLTDRNSTLWGGFLLNIAGEKIYFGGDSGYADHYQRTYERFGPVDLAFLPIGAYAPMEMFKPVHMDPTEAVQAHTDLHSRLSIGMHYGTFQLGAEGRTEPVELLDQAKQMANIPAPDFITLEIGQPFTISNDHLAQSEQTISLFLF